MFDLSEGQASATSVLEPSVIDAVTHALSGALEAPSGLDAAAVVDAIRALENLECVVTAAQAHLTVELDVSRREAQASEGVLAAHQGRGVAQEVAHARRESPHRGQRHLGLAKAVHGEMPATWEAWRTGRISEWKATMLARETACLTRDERLAVDHTVAANADRLEAMSVRQVVSAAQAEAARIDPASVVARRRLAETERRVTLRPAPDTMTWLTALLPVKDGVAAYAALARAADSARAAGDPRGKGQVMADALVGRVLEGAGTDSGRPGLSLHLVMSDQDLFGASDEPAYVEEYGPIPAELARELVVGSCTRAERTWVQRLYTHPTTGELVAAESRGRLFRRSLARFIRLRDRVCRTPWCDAPIRHVDHAVEHSAGGPTATTNSQGLCEACSYAKQMPGWRARPSPDSVGHAIETTLPTGHRYRSRPPRMVVTMRETPIRLDYIRAG
jgi:hypothetical protein